MFNEQMTKAICKLISDYCNTYPEAPRFGAEFVYQNNAAYDDAVALTANIMDLFAADFQEIMDLWEQEYVR